MKTTLRKLLELDEMYRKAYEILKDYLPNPDEVTVGDFEELEKMGIRVRPTAMGVTIGNSIFFRHYPPRLQTFIHELIHLARKPRADVPEEVYGYNISLVVVWMIEKNIKRGQPLLLYSLPEETVNRVLKSFGFESFEHFYLITGIVPYYYEIKRIDDEIRIVPIRKLSFIERYNVFLTEIISGAVVGNYICEGVLEKLLEETEKIK